MRRRHTESRKGRRGHKWFPNGAKGGLLLPSLSPGAPPVATASGADDGFIAAILASVFARSLSRGRR